MEFNQDFNKEFKTYFNKASSFKKQLILWGALTNPECSDQFCEDFMVSLGDNYEYILMADDTYKGFRTNEKTQLKPINKSSINKLDDYFNRLDGTLLTDLVYDFLETHKIF